MERQIITFSRNTSPKYKNVAFALSAKVTALVRFPFAANLSAYMWVLCVYIDVNNIVFEQIFYI